MAKYVLEDAFFSFNGVDLSDHVTRITIAATRQELASHAMGDTWEEFSAGLKAWSMNVEFHQDHAASNVDATLWAAFDAATNGAVIVRPDSAAVGTTNPEWTGNAICFQYSPIDGQHGALATTTVPFRGNGSLARATS